MTSIPLENYIINILELRVVGHYDQALDLASLALEHYPGEIQLESLMRRIRLMQKVKI